jgi:hypothetical protein|tara:strand:+ start:228 stop:500 length:273 start_codon:yes stop_codon:yes gene_type:complete
MVVEITLDKNKIKRGEDITILIKKGDSSGNQLTLTIHDESDDSIYAIGVTGDSTLDTRVISSADMEDWDYGRYFVRMFGEKNSCEFELIR